MIVDELELASADDVGHLPCDPLATGVRISSGEVHQRPVIVAERIRHAEQRLTLGDARAPGRVLRQGEESGCDGVTEPTASEVHADPYRLCLVGEQIHVMVAASDGAELRAGLATEILSRRRGNCLPGGVAEQWIVYRCIVGAVGASNTERDG